MKNYFLLVLGAILFISFRSSAQLVDAQELWTRFYTSEVADGSAEYAADMQVDGNGNIIVTGLISSDAIATVKYNSAGSLQWGRIYESAKPYKLELDADGNIYITGVGLVLEDASINHKVITIKYDASGDLKWSALYDGGGEYYDEGNDIAVDADGNVFVAARVSVPDDFYYRLTVIKYDSDGEEQWVQVYSSQMTQNSSSFARIGLDNSGNIFAGGTVRGTNGQYNFTDMLTLKYNASGELQWSSVYDGPENFADEYVELLIDPAGYVIAGGYVEPNSSAFDSDIIFVKYNPSTGAEEWASLYDGGNEYDDVAYDFDMDASGNIYAAAYSYKDGKYLAVVKYNSAGVLQGAGYAGDRYMGQMSLAVDASGNTYITGAVPIDKLDTEYRTYSFNNKGNLVWTETFHTEANWASAFIDLDGSGNVIVSTSGVDNLDDWYDFVTIKYEQVHLPVDDAIEEAVADVNLLPLGAGNRNALRSKLQNALIKYEGGDLNAAKNLLNAFINQLNQFVSNGDITAAQAQPLLDYVNLIIGEINLLLAKINVYTGPAEFALYQNYPNPFNPETKIKFDLAAAVNVELTIYNSLGEKVAELVNDYREAGNYEVILNGKGLSSGMYFYKIKAGEFQSVQKMILLK